MGIKAWDPDKRGVVLTITKIFGIVTVTASVCAVCYAIYDSVGKNMDRNDKNQVQTIAKLGELVSVTEEGNRIQTYIACMLRWHVYGDPRDAQRIIERECRRPT